MKGFRILILLLMVGILAAGCSHENDITGPANHTQNYYDKEGTETLGDPLIAIMAGSGFVEGGVGMTETDLGVLEITIPDGVAINQVLLYWAGATTGAPGDDMIKVDGNDVTGTLIGGPTRFYGTYYFSGYRADISDEPWLTFSDGLNSFDITDFEFDNTDGENDENNGISMVVIYDDGTTAEIAIRDGLDMAFFAFDDPLDRTEPQTFTFAAEPVDRTADLLLCVGSVYLDRPNQIKITTSAGDQYLDNVLNSTDGLTWDSMTLPVTIPAGDTSLTVALISTITPSPPEPGEPLGASMGWVGAGLSVPTSPPPELGCLGDYVWVDENMDGIQDDNEMGKEGVTVYLFDCDGNELAMDVTDSDGLYMFCELEEGQYMIQFMLPGGYEFSPQDMGGDDELDSDADPATGWTVCIDLGEGQHDLTWDAGLYVPEVPEIGCRMTGGGNDEFFFGDGAYNDYRFGGQAGAPIASPPQPWGNWTHTQLSGAAGSFTFHAGTPSAPEGTEIDWIECSDPGWCEQARPAPAKQLDFGGVGTFKNMRNAPAEIADHVIVGESPHWFEVNIHDLGEPGGHDLPDGCDPLGYGRNGGTDLGDCDCPDFYRILIYEGMDDSSNVMYEVYGYIDGGNFQIHPPTGRDRIELR